MTDLVARLRTPSSVRSWAEADEQRAEAAAEIERLRASERSAWNAAVVRDEEIERLRKMRDGLGAACDLSAARAEKAEAERDALQARLTECGAENERWATEAERAEAERDALRAELADLQRSIADLSHPNMRMLLAERDALRAERDDFHMQYRMKCDEETKALRAANTKLVGAIDMIRETLNGGEVQDLHQIINAALAEYRAAQKPSKAQELGTDIWAGLV